MAKGGSQSTQTVTNSEPWEGQQYFLRNLYGQANHLAASGVGTDFYPGDTFTPLSDDTLAGIDAIRANAGASPAGLDDAKAAASRAMTGGQENALDVLKGAARGGAANPMLKFLSDAAGKVTKAGAPVLSAAALGAMPATAGIDELKASAAGNPMLQQILEQSGRTTTAGNDVISGMASGDYLNNPHLDAAVDRAAAKIREQTGAAFSASGRYGSGAHGATLADSIGDVASSMYGTAYETNQNRMLEAARELGARETADINRAVSGAGAAASLDESRLARLFGVGSELGGRQAQDYARQIGAATTQAGIEQTDLARQGGLAQALAGLGEAGLDRQIGAANAVNTYGLNQTQQGLAASGLLPMFRDLDQAGARDLLGIGGILEGQAGEELAADINRWNFNQSAPWDNLGRLSAIINGGVNPGGTTSTVATGPGPNPLLGGLSGGAAGAGISSALGLTFAANPLLAGGLTAGGALLGLL